MSKKPGTKILIQERVNLYEDMAKNYEAANWRKGFDYHDALRYLMAATNVPGYGSKMAPIPSAPAPKAPDLAKKGERFTYTGPGNPSGRCAHGDIVELMEDQRQNPPGSPGSPNIGMVVKVRSERTGAHFFTALNPNFWKATPPNSQQPMIHPTNMNPYLKEGPQFPVETIATIRKSTVHTCEFVDMGFSFHKWVCKVCDKERL